MILPKTGLILMNKTIIVQIGIFRFIYMFFNGF